MHEFDNEHAIHTFQEELSPQDHIQIELYSFQIHKQKQKLRIRFLSGFQKGNLEEVKQQQQRKQSRYKDANLCGNSDTLKSFGPGVYLLFVFLGKLLILFTILSLISLVPIIYNSVAGQAIEPNYSGLNTKLAITTIGNHNISQNNSKTARYVNLTSASFILMFLFIFYNYLQIKMKNEKDNIQKDYQLTSYNIVLLEVQNCQTNQIRAYMERWGKVREVSSFKNIGDTVKYAKEIYKLKIYMKEIKKQIQFSDNQKEKDIMANQLRVYEKVCSNFMEDLKWKGIRESQIPFPNKYIVSYQQHDSKENIMKSFEKISLCSQYPQQLMIGEENPQLSEMESEPRGIFWQNFHLTWKNTLHLNIFQCLLVNLIAFMGLVLLVILTVSAAPLYYNKIDTTNHNQTTIITETNQTVTKAWCLKNQQQTSAAQDFCEPYNSLLRYHIFIAFSIAFVVKVLRAVVKQAILFLIPYQRYKTQADLSKTTTMQLFINYTAISVLVLLTLQSSLFGNSLKPMFSSAFENTRLSSNINEIHEYDDYTTIWYLDYGYQLILNWMIGILFPIAIIPLWQLGKSQMRLWRASQTKVKRKMKRQLQQGQFQIQDHYATSFMLMVVGLLFSAGMPIMIPLTLMALAIRYLYFKEMLLRNSKIPKKTGGYLSQITSKMVLLSTILFFMNGLWMFGVQSVFLPQQYLFQGEGIDSQSNASSFKEAGLVFFRRLINGWFFMLFFIIGVIGTLLRQPILRLVDRHIQGSIFGNRSNNSRNDKVVQQVVIKAKEDQLPASSLQKKMKCEFKIKNSYIKENNIYYEQVFKIANEKSDEISWFH